MMRTTNNLATRTTHQKSWCLLICLERTSKRAVLNEMVIARSYSEITKIVCSANQIGTIIDLMTENLMMNIIDLP